jgi:hypothetical protein
MKKWPRGCGLIVWVILMSHTIGEAKLSRTRLSVIFEVNTPENWQKVDKKNYGFAIQWGSRRNEEVKNTKRSYLHLSDFEEISEDAFSADSSSNVFAVKFIERFDWFRLLCSRSECPGEGVLANGETGTCAEWANGLSGFAPGKIEIWDVDFRRFVAAFVRPWGRICFKSLLWMRGNHVTLFSVTSDWFKCHMIIFEPI